MPRLTVNDLKGEQKRVLILPFENPVLIKGCAGSGKTTVAKFRALHLMQDQLLFQATNVAVFSYTNALISYIRSLTAPRSLYVTTLHSYAGRLCLELKKADDDKLNAAIHSAVQHARTTHNSQVAVLSKGLDFYNDEFSWIKGRSISTLDEYISTARTGRGTSARVTSSDKELLWTAFEHYNNSLSRQGLCDWSDLVLKALQKAEAPHFTPPFSHIVVDEAQDLTLAQLKLIAKLVSPHTNSITLVADSAQRIYQSGFSWADTGLNIRGRSFEFTKNYRNTRQIATAALSLLQKESDRTDFTDVELPEQMGAKPRLFFANSFEHQLQVLFDVLAQFAEMSSIAIASPSRKNVSWITKSLEAKGIAVVSLKNIKNGHPSRFCFVDTLHSLKGVEFDHVILCDLNSELLEDAPKEPDEDTVSLKRKLLYVGMTRSRCSLTMIASGKPSRLLADIDQSTIEVPQYPSPI